MDHVNLTVLGLAIAAVAFLYSSVGHAGASGYIATMALLGATPAAIRPTALVLNILVASIAAFAFWRAGHFDRRMFWRFGCLSVPAAYLGGYVQLPTFYLKLILGVVLLFSAFRLVFRQGDPTILVSPSLPTAMSVGGCIGLLSGLTGTGGGIFLTPLLLLRRWAHTRQAAAVSAMFILLNSFAGLFGYITAQRSLPGLGLPLAAAAIGGGLFGSYFGSRVFHVRLISLLLAAVLTIAGFKLIFTH
ncbi:MAG TPA: sulfite exporter TauE/SafE family protein [Chthoniobacterales bacterium]|nr:sulfite exporter TauE/SafE family protein [Chthoniobacterales bacterium]